MSDLIKREAKNRAQQESVKAVEVFAPPVEFMPPLIVDAPKPQKEDADPILKLAFTVTAPLSKLKVIKKFLDDGGYQYE